MLQYYTLEEAAKVLGSSAEQSKKLLDEHKIKQFRDGRGKVRYVASAVDLLARTLGAGSDPELQLGEPSKGSPEVFDFALGDDGSDEVPVGKTPAPKKGDSRRGGPRSPGPKPGSDSDVRLVSDGSEGFSLAADSDVQMVDDSGPVSSSKSLSKGGKKPDSDVRLTGATPADSGVRMVGDSSGETAALPKSASDSDIRLEQSGAHSGSDDVNVTEEIDLDAEQRRHEATTKKKKPKGTQAKLPPASPFELSDSDMPVADSSDFDLSPGASSGSLEIGSSELSAVPPSSSEDVEIGDLTPSSLVGNSGINIQKPSDSGIPIAGESGSEEIEFELSLESGTTPKPQPAKSDDSDSEFELSLAPESSEEQPALASSPLSDSDSEFELTLDDSSGGLQPLEADASSSSSSGEGDIFETDFEVPALEEESGSEAVALDDSDSDVESSEFDLALEEGDVASDDESGSQVVAMEDGEEASEAGDTVQRPRGGRRGGRQALVDDSAEIAVEEDDEEMVAAGAPAGRAAADQPWGAMPAAVMAPCLLVMFLAALMGFELVRGMWSYQQGGPVTGLLTEAMAKMFGQ